MSIVVDIDFDPTRLLSIADRAVRAAETACEQAARSALELHSAAVATGATPSGAPQKQNSAEWRTRKGGAPALFRTGLLANMASWTIERTGQGLRLLPPAQRRQALTVLHRRGYRTILQGVPDSERAETLKRWGRAWALGGK